MSFEFATAARIVFGEGRASETVKAAAAFGSRPLLVTGASRERIRRVLPGFVPAEHFATTGEPTVESIRMGAELARAVSCDCVIAVGGGSSLDAGKAIAALLTNPGDPLEYLEVIGRAQPLPNSAAPVIAVPTTAGTGSEVTRNAVLGSEQHHVKASLRSASMLPKLALVDPELTYTLPRNLTAYTGLDALTQLIEPYVSVRANVFTDMFCVEGIRLVANALPKACDEPGDNAARAAMARASLLGGLALANAGLGVVHGFAAPLGGMFPVPHGAACAAVLPHAIAVNAEALRSRAPESPALDRYREVACLLTGRPQATVQDGVQWVAELCRRLEIPPLSAWGVNSGDVPDLADKASRTSSMKGNPIELRTLELEEVASRALT